MKRFLLLLALLVLPLMLFGVAFAQDPAPGPTPFDWSGVLLPLLTRWMPKEIAIALIGVLVAVVTSFLKPKASPGDPPRPAAVAIPAAVGGVLAGPIGVLAPAIGDGLRRAGWALLHWIGRKTGVIK